MLWLQAVVMVVLLVLLVLGVVMIAAFANSIRTPLLQAVELADAVAEELAVPVRIDADLDALDVAGFGHGGHPSSHCAEALQSIADLHRGEHVVVVGGVPAPEGAAVLRRLEIGDDGWDLLPETQSD